MVDSSNLSIDDIRKGAPVTRAVHKLVPMRKWWFYWTFVQDTGD